MEEIIAAQLGRPLQLAAESVRSCHLGLPLVVKSGGETRDGRPFPTSYWLSCPLACRRIGRLEGQGAVKTLNQRIDKDPDFSEGLRKAHEQHDDLTQNPRRMGIGGTRGSVKCLHAHAGFQLAGGQSPAGEWTLHEIGALRCESPCVVKSGEEIIKNPDWRPAPQGEKGSV